MEQKVVQKAPEQAKKSKPNMTGIPTQMKLDFERRSGLSFDDVRVHYNSDKPRKIGALAYTQIPQVHIGPGQERHLRHELGHVVQQKQGIVRPTTWINGLPVNDSEYYENMASAGKFDSVSMHNNTQYVIQKTRQQVPRKGVVRPRSGSSDDKVEREAKKPRPQMRLGQIANTVSQSLKTTLRKSFTIRTSDGSEKTVVPIRYGNNQSLTYLREPSQEELSQWGPGPTTTPTRLSSLLQVKGKLVFSHTPTSYESYPTKQHMRWVSTAVATLVGANDEIQCYLDEPNDTIIVSANLDKTLGLIRKKVESHKTLGGLKRKLNRYIEGNGDQDLIRSQRHIQRLMKSKKYDAYHIRAVDPHYLQLSETDGIHAEVKIVLEFMYSNSKFYIDKLGGIRVPCLCCSVILLNASSMDERERNTFLSGRDPICRIGPLWPSISSVKGVLAYFWTLGIQEEKTLESTANAKILQLFGSAAMTVTAVESKKRQVYSLKNNQDCDSETESEDLP